MRDLYRNRIALGSIPQLSTVAPVFYLTKNLTFDVSTDLTSNFTQFIPNGSQGVSGGLVQFRNNVYDVDNHIENKFTVTKMLSMYIKHNWWRGGNASQESYNLSWEILNGAGAVVDRFDLSGSYSHSYNDGSPQYWNAGYLFWRFKNDAYNITSKRLAGCPSGSHSYEIIDVGGGYIQVKVDGANVGSQIYLGASDYKLGGKFTFSPLGGWYNNSIYCDLDTFNLTYL